jgi:FG-GAP-like repeat
MKNIKKFLNKRNVIIASVALVLLFAFALFNPWTNLIDKAFASDESSFFSSLDTSDFKNLQMPDKGGNIIYATRFAQPTDKADLWTLNCNTKSIKSLGKLGVNVAYNSSRVAFLGTPGYYNSKNKLSWLLQYYHRGSFGISGASEDWFIDGNTGNKSKLGHQVYRQGWVLSAVGDFNGDGIDDPIWRNLYPKIEGRVAVWYNLNPQNTTTDSQWLENVPDSNWRIKGAGDVNGDGKAEILWYHQRTNQVALWTYRNGRHEGLYLPNNIISYSDQLVGLADCDGDGKSEFIFRDWDTKAGGYYLGYWKIDPNTMTSMQGDKQVITRDRDAAQDAVYVRTGTF